VIIYDPSNKKAFGDPLFDENGITFRYLSVRKGLSKFIPYGPSVSDYEALEIAAEKVAKLKCLKLKVDLPNIFNDQVREKIVTDFEKKGFKKAKYLVDDQTIIIEKDKFNIEKKDRYYVRKSKENFDFEIKSSLTQEEVNKVYEIYLESASRKNFRPKRIEVFELHKIKTHSVLAKQGEKIMGFVLGEIVDILDEEHYDVLYNLYTAAHDEAFEKYVGYGMYETWLSNAFEKGISKVDMYGAKEGSAYATFKRKFVYKNEMNSTKKLPGSFIKYKFF